jgi:hypothetical protein
LKANFVPHGDFYFFSGLAGKTKETVIFPQKKGTLEIGNFPKK